MNNFLKKWENNKVLNTTTFVVSFVLAILWIIWSDRIDPDYWWISFLTFQPIFFSFFFSLFFLVKQWRSRI